VVNVLPALTRFDVRIIAMTGNARSVLAPLHIHLDVSVELRSLPAQRATSSTTVMPCRSALAMNYPWAAAV
jgi:D-arabinose 5-phosphate isomerase GutQ